MAARSVPECGAAGAQGWNIDFGAWSSCCSQVQPVDHRKVGGSGTRRGFGWVLDTLLGPEGSDESCSW